MRAFLNDCVAATDSLAENSVYPFQVLRKHKITQAFTRVSWADSIFTFIRINGQQLIQISPRFTSADKNHDYSIIFHIKRGLQRIRGQGIYVAFSFAYDPGKQLETYIDGHLPRKFSFNRSVCTLKQQPHNTPGTSCLYGKIDGENLQRNLIITSMDCINTLRIYQNGNQTLTLPLQFKRFTTAEAIPLSKASMKKLSLLQLKKIITEEDKKQAKRDYYFIWQSLWIANRSLPAEQRKHAYVETCYRHCNVIWNRCLALEKHDMGSLVKRAIAHIVEVSTALHQHLELGHFEKKNHHLERLLTKEVNPKIYDCSSTVWKAATAASLLTGSMAAVAVVAAVTFGS
jgi:hypothetical protein